MTIDPSAYQETPDMALRQDAIKRQLDREKAARDARRAEEKKRHEKEQQAREHAEREARERAEQERVRLGSEAEARAKAEARRRYPYSDEAFEQDWPTIRAEMAAGSMQEKAARPRDYMDGGIGGGRGEPVKPSETFRAIDR